MMNFTVALLTFGVILLLVGIAGKIQAKEISVGTDSKLSRVIVGVLGAILIAVALSKEGIDLRDPLAGINDPDSESVDNKPSEEIKPIDLNPTADSSAESNDEATLETAANEEAATAAAKLASEEKAAADRARAELARIKAELAAKKREQERQQRNRIIRVVRASYGVQRAYCDPTDMIKTLCDGRDRCEVKIDNTLCGDPLYGEEKEARIEYFCGDRHKVETTAEEEIAYLKCE